MVKPWLVPSLGIFCLAVLLLISCSKGPERDSIVVFSGSTMGTTYSIKVSGFPAELEAKVVQKDIETLLARINRSMSTYIPESEISRFNRFNSTAPFPVSSILLEVLSEALRISALTSGAFDPTVAPLIDLWGFGAGSATSAIPDAGQIMSLLKRTGYKKIRLTNEPSTISKLLPELTIDLSAVAKGYAVDQVSLLLEGMGVTGYLVEIGGEIRTGGYKVQQVPWVVGIERPVYGERAIQEVVTIGSNSMATSGDYRNYFEKDGKRFSHLIDPSSGRPIDHRLASISVVHQSCMTADALATAFMILGPDKAYQLAMREKLAIYMLVRTQAGFKVITTPAFSAYLIKK